MSSVIWEFPRSNSSSPWVAKLFRWPQPKLRVDGGTLFGSRWIQPDATWVDPDLPIVDLDPARLREWGW